MEWLLASAVGVLAACGVFLLLRARSFDVVLGLTLLSYAVNLFLFLAGGMAVGRPPILRPGASSAAYADPLPQALVLTAIVIGLAMTALFLVLALRAAAETGGDHVDGGRRDVGREGP